MKVLVTGGAGFIGSNLVDFLVKKKNKVIVIDNLSSGRILNLDKSKKKIKLIIADLSKYGPWKKNFKGVDIVYHIAGLGDLVPSVKDPRKYFFANVNATLNVVEACREFNVKKIVYTASSTCYGLAKKIPTSENDKIDIQHPYALTKYLGEQILLFWSKIYKIKVISLRLFNIYGLRSRTSGAYGAVFGTFLKQKISNKPLTVVGDGKQKRDFLHVDDLVRLFIKCSKIGKTGVYNVGKSEPVSINKIVNIFKSRKINIPKRPGEPKITYANINKIKKATNWRPKIDIVKGTKELLENIEMWKYAPLWTPKKIKKANKYWFKYLGK